MKVIKLPVDAPLDSTVCFALEDFPENLLRQIESFPALCIPATRTMELRKKLSTVLLRRPRLKTVLTIPDHPEQRILILDPLQNVWTNSLVQQVLTENSCVKVTKHTQMLSYDDYSAEEVLRKLLPLSVEVPSAFDAVGPIAHINLRDETRPYKYWIGKVLLDKNKSIRTVVNKLGSIANEYRTFGMEVVAGDASDNWSIVTTKEDQCQFQLDFQHVYWNSRLAGEHKRLTSLLLKLSKKQSLIVADLMAGIGPFAVPLTCKGPSNITVYANDLNPVSYKYLQINAVKNNCCSLHSFSMDARAFVHKLQADNIIVDHVIMNLPASAPEFLDAFRGYRSERRQPVLHVHCFCAKQSQEAGYPEAVERCASALGCSLDRMRDKLSIHTVRDVSPTKNMICVSFVLPEGAGALTPIDFAVTKTTTSINEVAPIVERETKRIKMDAVV